MSNDIDNCEEFVANKICGNCEYARPENKRLFCHKYAPRPNTSNPELAFATVAWPRVEDDEYCGEFKEDKSFE